MNYEKVLKELDIKVDPIEFNNWIEKHWEEGMSWENYGEWVVKIKKLPNWVKEEISLNNVFPIWNKEDKALERDCTIILDIDGCILYHLGNSIDVALNQAKILPGVKEQFIDWTSRNYKIILTTARKESLRELTVKQLNSFGLSWDYLLMGIGSGQRILINDIKFYPTALAYNVPRNKGLGSFSIEDLTEEQNLIFVLKND